MPFVLVNHTPNPSIANNITEPSVLPPIIAKALHVASNPEAHLTKDDIRIKFFEYGKNDITGGLDFEIIIFANEYPERAANLQTERVPEIRDALVEKFGDRVKFEVYVHLGTGGFVEYKGRK